MLRRNCGMFCSAVAQSRPSCISIHSYCSISPIQHRQTFNQMDSFLLRELSHPYFKTSRFAHRGFFGKLADRVREELSQNKDIKSSIEKFREETSKLNESDKLKAARTKYEKFEKETSVKSEILKEKFGDVSGKVKESLDEFGKSEFGKRTSNIVGSVGDSVKFAGETISKSGRAIADSEAFKHVSSASEAVRKNIEEELSRAKVYSSPSTLKSRSDFQIFSRRSSSSDSMADMPINETEQRVELHKDAKWYQQWTEFKDNNPVFNRMFDLKNKYEESDNPVIASTRFVTEKFSNIFSGIMTPNKVSQVMSEVQKVDPTFSMSRFTDILHKIVFPNVVEALHHGNLKVLEDWCNVPAYSKITAQIEPLLKQGYRIESTVLDLTEPEIMNAEMAENSVPVVIVQFETQAMCVVKDRHGKVMQTESEAFIGGNVEGQVEKYHWFVALTRDMDDVDPISSWRIGDIEIRRRPLAF